MNRFLFHTAIAAFVTVCAVAVPTHQAAADSPLSSSVTTRAWVGVVLGDADSQPGVEVDTVLRRSPAYAAGIEDGNRILSVNGRQVRTPGKLESILHRQPAGRTISMSIERDGDTEEVELSLMPSPDAGEVLRLHHRGYDVPSVRLQDLDGQPVDLSDIGDRPVVLEFWATWCSVCRQVSRKLEAAVDEHPGAFDVLSITSEDASTVTEHLETQPKAHDIAIDPDERAHEEFLVNSYPFVAVINPDGTIEDVTTNVGAVDDLIHKLIKDRQDE